VILHVFAHRRRDEAEDETAKLQRGSLLVLGRVKLLDGEVVGVLSQGLMLLPSLAPAGAENMRIVDPHVCNITM